MGTSFIPVKGNFSRPILRAMKFFIKILKVCHEFPLKRERDALIQASKRFEMNTGRKGLIVSRFWCVRSISVL